MCSPSPSPESFEYGPWDPLEDVFSQQETQQEDNLGFCQYRSWDKERTYAKDYIHYTIEWEVKVNKRKVSKETEQDLVLAPAEYWEHFLEHKLEKVVLRKERTSNRTLASEDTAIVVIVTQQRSEPSLTKSFEETNIDWPEIEKQLIAWGDLFLAGKKLRVNISFNYNYVETGQQPATSSRNITKRRSTTQRMLTELNTQLEGEKISSGQPSIWREVYKIMRCDGPPCNKGPHCWCDPIGKKHYTLKTRHLTSLIMYVEKGGILETQDDVPHEIRQQLYAEDQLSLDSKRQKSSASAANLPPIHITNTLPASSCQTCQLGSSLGRIPVPDVPALIPRVNIPGFRDKALEKYCAWQQSKVTKPAQKQEFQKACDILTDDCMTLQLICQNPDPKYLIDKGGC
jgi:hypothetical protein